MDKLISRDNVRLAKQKGFPQVGNSLFGETKDSIYLIYEIPEVLYIDGHTRSYWYNTESKNRVGVRPTQTTMCKWLRNKHKIFVESYTNRFGEHIGKVRRFNKLGKLQSSKIITYGSYEDAIEAGITKALNYLENV